MTSERLGMGVMIKMLGGGDCGAECVAAVAGDQIRSIKIKDDGQAISLTFESGTLDLCDEGQSCCENRYMSTDDSLEDFVGAKFLGAEVRPGPELQSEYGDIHQTEFLIIKTSAGEFTIVNHNEHNGYYGGFWIRASFKAADLG